MTQRTTPEEPQPAARILIVDDSEDDAYIVATHVRRRYPGAHFVRVDKAEDMARALAEGEWDLVISDHSMPRFDSLAALEVLKASGCDAPFVIYSGQIAADAGIAAMHGGARDFVPKSAPERLLPVIDRELESVRLRRAKELAERAVIELANYDELTRLPNRNLFTQLTDLRLAEAAGGEGGGAVCYLDLDRFMRINDSFGYATGDALIRQVATRLQAALGERDVLARFGQDEFGLLLDEPRGAAAVGARLTRLMRDFAAPFVHGGQEFYFTLSIGVATFPGTASDAATVLKNAESAMFAVKRRGRNGYEFYRAELGSVSMQRFRLEADLRHAIERRQLFLVFQPIVALATGEVIGAEALLRWRHPELGLVPPDQFIPVADDTGQIVSIGNWVLREACAAARAWSGGRALSVAVNVSPAQFKQPGLAASVAAVMPETARAPQRLTLEITESLAMQDAEATIETLRALKRMGVCIAIDDFGTGYSSLAYLKRFPIDVLKIDKSFVREIARGPEDAAIVDTIAALGRMLRLQRLAEGVETEEQCRFLAGLGIDHGQGFYFSRPLAAEAFVAFAEKRHAAPGGLKFSAGATDSGSKPAGPTAARGANPMQRPNGGQR